VGQWWGKYMKNKTQPTVLLPIALIVGRGEKILFYGYLADNQL